MDEDRLRELLETAGDSYPVPPGGPQAILAAAEADGRRFAPPEAERARHRQRSRLALPAAAAAVIVVGVVAVFAGLAGRNEGPTVALTAPPTAAGRAAPEAAPVPPPAAALGVPAGGTLSIEVDAETLEATVAALEGLATGAGGNATTTLALDGVDHRGVTVVLAVPADRYDALADAASRLGRVVSADVERGRPPPGVRSDASASATLTVTVTAPRR